MYKINELQTERRLQSVANKEVLTPIETSIYLGISPYTCYKWLSANKIPFVLLGGKKRIYKKDLNSLLDSRRVKTDFELSQDVLSQSVKAETKKRFGKPFMK